MALILGNELYGAVTDASAASAEQPVTFGASSHTKGPSVLGAAAGGPKELPNMCDALRDAASHADASCITFVANGDASVESFAELLTHARRMLEALQLTLQLSRGDTVALQIAEARMHLRAFWGCALGGIAPVTVAVPNHYSAENATVQKLLGAISVLDAKHVIASASGVGSLGALLPAGVRVHDVATLLGSASGGGSGLSLFGVGVRGPEHDVPVQPDDVLFYQLTSGSTGTPKCIPEQHGAVISHIRHSAAHCSYSRDDVTLNWLPFDHVVPMLTFHLADVSHAAAPTLNQHPYHPCSPLILYSTPRVDRSTSIARACRCPLRRSSPSRCAGRCSWRSTP